MDRRCFGFSTLFAAGAVVATGSGCMGLVANLMYAVNGEMVPAEYEGLVGKRVAVVTITDRSAFSDDIAARILSRHVGETLEAEVKDLKLVDEEKIDRWRDENGWDASDFTALGQGVEADKVVLIELTDLKLRDGATLYRGRAGVTTTVYDVAEDRRDFRRHIDEFVFPVTTGQYASDTTETRFRRNFLMILGRRISRYFHPYDFKETVALDAAFINA